MIPPIYQWLSGSSSIVALVEDRIYGSGIATQQGEPPWQDYIVYQLVSKDSQICLGRRQDLDYDRVQIHCWSQDESRAEALADLCWETLEAYGRNVGGAIQDFDPDVKMYRCGFDYGGWRDRP